MLFKKSYVYFVSFWNADQSKNGFGFGNGEFTFPHKIKSMEDVRSMEAHLNKGSTAKYTVINYKLFK